MRLFDQLEWEKKVRDPFWYRDVPELMERMTALYAENRDEFALVKEEIYSFFDRQLQEGNIFLGVDGKKWNAERKPIDTIVIHHTSNPEGLTKERLSAIELIRLYAPAYAKRDKNEPIYSDHIRNGAQVFYPYHWIIRSDGSTERLLMDNETGWHAGNWDINCRSVAICIDDDHEFSIPDRHELKVIAALIKAHYPSVPKERVYGHREINPKTTCPSEFFLDGEHGPGWKGDLLRLL